MPVVAALHSGDIVPWALLYIGPDVLLPVTSAIAAIAGLALMFWNRVVSMIRGTWRKVFRSKP